MIWIAIKMLTANRGKYYAIIFGVAFACMLMAQQTSIFVGLMRNTTSQIRDIHGPDLWIMDPSVDFIDDITPLSDNALYQVRGVPGVAWTQRLYKGTGRAQFPDGSYKTFLVLGLDDQSLMGAPAKMLVGSLADLRRPDAVVMDVQGYRYLWPGQPLQTGKTFEMNDHRAQVVGVCHASPTFQTLPVIYTRYSLALNYAAQERRVLSFILAKAEPGVPLNEVCDRISLQTGLLAVSSEDFAWKTIWYYVRRTGIPINVGTTVLLAFIIGAAIAGQTFYLFTLGNLKQFGALKAMGTSNLRILGMVMIQGLLAGAIGYALGLGAACLMEVIMRLSMTTIPPVNFMAWQIPLGAAAAVGLIIAGSTVASLHKVIVLEPAEVFK
jgi:putative ABC transport system permease protein